MWIPSKLVDLFTDLRSEAAALRAQNQILERELASSKISQDWLRIQFNNLSLERAELLKKVHGIQVPIPQLGKPIRPEEFSFEDVGNERAKEMGLPVYD